MRACVVMIAAGVVELRASQVGYVERRARAQSHLHSQQGWGRAQRAAAAAAADRSIESSASSEISVVVVVVVVVVRRREKKFKTG